MILKPWVLCLTIMLMMMMMSMCLFLVFKILCFVSSSSSHVDIHYPRLQQMILLHNMYLHNHQHLLCNNNNYHLYRFRLSQIKVKKLIIIILIQYPTTTTATTRTLPQTTNHQPFSQLSISTLHHPVKHTSTTPVLFRPPWIERVSIDIPSFLSSKKSAVIGRLCHLLQSFWGSSLQSFWFLAFFK